MPESSSSSPSATVRLAIDGMHCAACAARIERVTGRLPGVSAAAVSLPAKEGAFAFDPRMVDPAAIQKAIEEAGFSATPIEEADPDEELRRQDAREAARVGELSLRAALAWVFAGPLLVVAMGPMVGLPALVDPHGSPQAATVLQFALALATAWVCRAVYRDGLQALLRRAPTMDSLVALGTGAAFLHSVGTVPAVWRGEATAHDLYFESAATVLAMIALGRALESRAMRQAAEAVRGLLRLAPEEASLVAPDGSERRVPVRLVVPGVQVRVRPGERLPVDGTVAGGEAHVDESMLTGESRPVRRAPGDKVFTGTIALDGSLLISATHVGRETLLARVAAFVAQAQATKAPIAALADRISAVFVPAVLGIALLTALVWFALAPAVEALRHAVAVLVIACPCAMGLATPTAILVGSGRGARLGVLFKSGAAMERLAAATDIVLDKTGTLTEGRMQVLTVLPVAHLEASELLALAAAVERGSEHPVARAIAAAGHSALEAEAFQAFPGRGVAGSVAGKRVLVGSRRLLLENEVVPSPEAEAEAARLEATGATVVFVAVAKRFAGLVAVGDALRPEAPAAVATFRALGFAVHLLSGDTSRVAWAVAGQLGIDSVQAEVLPDGKAAWVQALRESGRRPVMVGDGINDAPALAAAWVGVAMGSGQDIAVQAGDVVLVRGTLTALGEAVVLARATMRHVRQNLFWAFAFNTMGIPLAAGVVEPFLGWSLSPMFAGAAMAASSLLVVGNALRLRWVPLSDRGQRPERGQIWK